MGLRASLRGSCILSITSRSAKRGVLPKAGTVLSQDLQMTATVGRVCAVSSSCQLTLGTAGVLFVVCACAASTTSC